MKRYIVWVILFLVAVLVISRYRVEEEKAEAQIYGTNYYWQDSLAVTTTAVDSVFSDSWYDVSIWFSGCTGLIKAGAPDTVGMGAKSWIILEAGQVMGWGAATKLKALSYKASSGTGALYMVGYKKVSQF